MEQAKSIKKILTFMEYKISLWHSQSISGLGLETNKPRKHTHILLL